MVNKIWWLNLLSESTTKAFKDDNGVGEMKETGEWVLFGGSLIFLIIFLWPIKIYGIWLFLWVQNIIDSWFGPDLFDYNSRWDYAKCELPTAAKVWTSKFEQDFCCLFIFLGQLQGVAECELFHLESSKLINFFKSLNFFFVISTPLQEKLSLII